MTTQSSFLQVAQRKTMAAKYLARKEFYRLCRKSDFTWRYVANLKPWLKYQKLRKPLTGTQRRVLHDLKRDGVALTSVDEFLYDPGFFEELAEAVQKREAGLAEVIAKARASAAQEGEIKSYLVS